MRRVNLPASASARALVLPVPGLQQTLQDRMPRLSMCISPHHWRYFECFSRHCSFACNASHVVCDCLSRRRFYSSYGSLSHNLPHGAFSEKGVGKLLRIFGICRSSRRSVGVLSISCAWKNRRCIRHICIVFRMSVRGIYDWKAW